MALKTVFHKGVVTAPDRAEHNHGTPDFGVYGADDFKVSAHPSIPFAVLVRKGRAHRYKVTSIAEIDQTLPCTTLAGPASNVRWDLIVVRDDWGAGTSVLAAIPVGASAVIPRTLANNPGVLVEQPLALVKWQGGTSAPVQFIDLRCWAANGGMIAADKLCLEYLARPGADVLVNGTTWRYSLGANGVWGWVDDSAGSLFGAGNALIGPAPGPSAKLLVQAGTAVSQADAAGYSAIGFPKPFPNGVLYVNPSQGDAGVNTARANLISLVIAGAPDWKDPVTLTRFTYAVQGTNGKNIPGALHRATWIAVGY